MSGGFDDSEKGSRVEMLGLSRYGLVLQGRLGEGISQGNLSGLQRQRQRSISVNIIPLTLPAANHFIERHHRHHGILPGGFAWWAIGAVENGEVVGVALAGRPTNRNNDDGQTVEVQRVATDGTFNACSALYGACARAAKAIGAARIITYTLNAESGGSLRGAGWIREADGISSWWWHRGADGNGRTPAVDRPHMAEGKVRWAKHFREPIEVSVDFEVITERPGQIGLLE